MVGKIERKRKDWNGQKEIGIKPEIVKVAETLGKFTRMTAKNGVGDKGGKYGH